MDVEAIRTQVAIARAQAAATVATCDAVLAQLPQPAPQPKRATFMGE